MEHLDGKVQSNNDTISALSYFVVCCAQHTIFGEVAEGLDVLQKINELYTDEQFRPFQDVRILYVMCCVVNAIFMVKKLFSIHI